MKNEKYIQVYKIALTGVNTQILKTMIKIKCQILDIPVPTFHIKMKKMEFIEILADLSERIHLINDDLGVGKLIESNSNQTEVNG